METASHRYCTFLIAFQFEILSIFVPAASLCVTLLAVYAVIAAGFSAGFYDPRAGAATCNTEEAEMPKNAYYDLY